jgi:hypothetical protein
MTAGFALTCRFDVLDGGRRVALEDEPGDAYLGGCKFALELLNTATLPLTVTSMRLEMIFRAFESVRFSEKERRYGTAREAHQLFVELDGDRWSGWWNLAAGAEIRAGLRAVTSDAEDLFASPSEIRLSFALAAGESERIEGALLTAEPGMYEVRMAALAERGSWSRACVTAPIRIAHGEGQR